MLHPIHRIGRLLLLAVHHRLHPADGHVVIHARRNMHEIAGLVLIAVRHIPVLLPVLFEGNGAENELSLPAADLPVGRGVEDFTQTVIRKKMVEILRKGRPVRRKALFIIGPVDFTFPALLHGENNGIVTGPQRIHAHILWISLHNRKYPGRQVIQERRNRPLQMVPGLHIAGLKNLPVILHRFRCPVHHHYLIIIPGHIGKALRQRAAGPDFFHPVKSKLQPVHPVIDAIEKEQILPPQLLPDFIRKRRHAVPLQSSIGPASVSLTILQNELPVPCIISRNALQMRQTFQYPVHHSPHRFPVGMKLLPYCPGMPLLILLHFIIPSQPGPALLRQRKPLLRFHSAKPLPRSAHRGRHKHHLHHRPPKHRNIHSVSVHDILLSCS